MMNSSYRIGIYNFARNMDYFERRLCNYNCKEKITIFCNFSNGKIKTMLSTLGFWNRINISQTLIVSAINFPNVAFTV